MIDPENHSSDINAKLSSPLLVEASFSGKQWQQIEYNQRHALALNQKSGLSPIIAQIMVSRDIGLDHYQSFLTPRLRDLLPDPFSLIDMDKAAQRIARAIKDREKIALFGDYDVDGATSTALMKRFLAHFNIDARFYIPDRIKEGYGPNTLAIEQLCHDHDLIITLDCGITSFEPLQRAQELKTDVVVLDHHGAEPELPPAVAVVNPNRLDDKSGQGHMAAVGVTFLTIIAICKQLEKSRFFQNNPKPDPRQWLDIVALGTICDVVPLKGINRAYVKQGLKVMAMRQNIGITALSDLAGIDEKPSTYHAGFVIGPRINAGGRVGDAHLGVELLYTDSTSQARQIAQILDQNNRDRQEIEKTSLNEAIHIAEQNKDQQKYVLFVVGHGWHPGIIGLMASRLKDRYNRPVCAITIDENGIGKASARSIHGIDLGNLVIAARQKDILINGGGHSMAAGFTVAQDKIDELHNFMTQRIIDQHGTTPLKPKLNIDAIISLQSVKIDFAHELQKLSPFGVGHPQPRFMIQNCRLVKIEILKKAHLRIIISDSSGQNTLKIMSFRSVETPLGQKLLSLSPSTLINIVGTLRINHWRGKESADFTLEDAVLA